MEKAHLFHEEECTPLRAPFGHTGASQIFAVRRQRKKMEYVFLPALPVKKLFSGIYCARRARQIPAIPHFSKGAKLPWKSLKTTKAFRFPGRLLW
jgi:hypothetical protein